MDHLLQGVTILGTRAGFGADASLAVMVLAAALFTVGWRLAVRKRFQAHRWVQTAAACLNAIPVLAWMIRSFAVNFAPGLSQNLSKGVDVLTLIHVVVGITGLLLGVFVVLRGNELVPQAVRFSNYKRFMRTSYALYMLGTLTGVIVYLVVYVGGAR